MFGDSVVTEPVILLIGATGQVGSALRLRLAARWPIHTPPRRVFDLTDMAEIGRKVRDIGPSLIINAAAYTDVDRAEDDVGPAMAVNGEAPGLLAETAKELGIPFIHFSSDYVFGGGRDRPIQYALREGDTPSPDNYYGETKLAGENAVAAVGGDHLIFRLSWVFSSAGQNFLNRVKLLARGRSEISIVDDQIGCPTWADDVADTTTRILAGHWDPVTGRFSANCGLYHLASGGRTSWNGFAREILSVLKCPTKVLPISSDEFGSRAKRPAFSVLDTAKLKQAFGITPRHWQEQLHACLNV